MPPIFKPARQRDGLCFLLCLHNAPRPPRTVWEQQRCMFITPRPWKSLGHPEVTGREDTQPGVLPLLGWQVEAHSLMANLKRKSENLNCRKRKSPQRPKRSVVEIRGVQDRGRRRRGRPPPWSRAPRVYV